MKTYKKIYDIKLINDRIEKYIGKIKEYDKKYNFEISKSEIEENYIYINIYYNNILYNAIYNSVDAINEYIKGIYNTLYIQKENEKTI